jgi:putative hemolysin
VGIGTDIAVIVGLTLLNGFFSGAEIAVLSTRKTRLRELADEGRRSAVRALELRGDPERFLATVQVGITVVSATAAAFGGSAMEEPLAQWLTALGAGDYAGEIALAIVIALVSFLSIVLGELVPKSLALRASEGFTLLVARPILALRELARPIVWLLTVSSNIILRPFHDKTNFSESRLSPEELQQLVEESATAGALDAHAGEIASRAIDLGDLRVAAVMVPRIHIAGIAQDADRDEVQRVLGQHPHARYPVFGDLPEQVAGYVTARDLYIQLVRGSVNIRSVLHRVPFFPEQSPAMDVLRELQRQKTRLGIVVDELGGVAGLVTVEDITEELVGEILGEHEQSEPVVQAEGEGTYLIDAATPVHEINRELDIALAQGPGWSTLAGLLINEAERIPEPGTTITLPDGIRADIVDADPTRIRVVRLRLPTSTGEAAPEGTDQSPAPETEERN